jgi:hypothetical protein
LRDGFVSLSAMFSGFSKQAMRRPQYASADASSLTAEPFANG